MMHKISIKIRELGEKKKDLESDINRLIAIRENETKKISDLAESMSDLRQNCKLLEGRIETTYDLGFQGIRQSTDAINLSIGVLRQIGFVANETFDMLDRLNKIVDTRLVEVGEKEIDIIGRSKLVVKELESLAVRKKDLDVYKTRLQLRYNELGLGDLIL